ncbi:hypothetical protein DPEC_G00287200 [Dallia pectoralis]|uniref:Uncharacterized protein n=1 Tax=Dallia pectoralis TaxID=75939 RepID=A0ACC2FKE3_DALPE|nr:hypothetical protein DPEC_G00287200 [Dallia pectoralis]
MKSTCVFLLLFLSGTYSVEALKCFLCGASTSNVQCNQNTMTCSLPDNTCLTSVLTISGSSMISKLCSNNTFCAWASTTNYNNGGMSSQFSCCQTDLCNVNASSVCSLNLLLCVACLLSGLVLFESF